MGKNAQMTFSDIEKGLGTETATAANHGNNESKAQHVEVNANPFQLVQACLGNPMPMALLGFLMALTPVSCALMGWRGAGGLGAAEIGVFYFFGGLLMIIASFLEFFLGHTFQFAVFGSFGAFWLSFAATLTPANNAAAAYQPDSPETALANPTFNATFAYFPLFMGLLCFIYFIASLKTNLILMLTFLLLVPGCECLAAVFFKASQGVATTTLQTASGGCFFVVCLLCWYLLTAQILASVGFPLTLPLGDLNWLYVQGRKRLRGGQN